MAERSRRRSALRPQTRVLPLPGETRRAQGGDGADGVRGNERGEGAYSDEGHERLSQSRSRSRSHHGGTSIGVLPFGDALGARRVRAVRPRRGVCARARARLGSLGVGALGFGSGRAVGRVRRGRGEDREGPLVSARPSIERVLLSRVRRKRYLRAQPPALQVPRLRGRGGVQAQPDPVPVHGVRRGEHMRAQAHALPVQGLRRELHLPPQARARVLQGMQGVADLRASPREEPLRGVPRLADLPARRAEGLVRDVRREREEHGGGEGNRGLERHRERGTLLHPQALRAVTRVVVRV
mmetsp:Transcript_6840/g.27964  ORF Transcript_6840/g.27964 Transcript_6840/m.27964 type:complete len:297 (+) Transcript_6840:1049-1939(+)